MAHRGRRQNEGGRLTNVEVELAVAPVLRLPARLCDHPVREGRHEARSLGEREEIGRRHEAFTVLPADERFGPDDLAGVQADKRLVVEDEAVAALDGRAQAPAIEAA